MTIMGCVIVYNHQNSVHNTNNETKWAKDIHEYVSVYGKDESTHRS